MQFRVFPEISFVIISEDSPFVNTNFLFFSRIFWLYSAPEGCYVKIWKNAVLFYMGGCAYMALELLFRGRTHGSMFLAGGLCFLLIGFLGRARPRLPGLLLPLAGAMIITAVELAVGLAVNREWTVWDYRNQWGNFCGQICPLFSLLWIPAARLALGLYDALEPRLPQGLPKKSMLKER